MNYKFYSQFDFIQGKIHVLVIDPNPDEIENIVTFLQEHYLYSVTFAKDMQLADRLLSNGHCYHVCISELCDSNASEDKFLLQKKYGHSIPIIYISNYQCLESGFKLKEFGAKNVYNKPLTPGKCKEVLVQINECFLEMLLLPQKGCIYDDLVKICCDIIRVKKPETVAQWAADAGIDESYLRKKWKLWFKIPPKNILNLYWIFYKAFKQIELELKTENEADSHVVSDKFAKYRRFYRDNKGIIESIIYRGKKEPETKDIEKM